MPEKFYTFLLIIVAVVVFQIFAKDLFPNGGMMRMLCAALAGAVGGGIGSFIDQKRL